MKRQDMYYFSSSVTHKNPHILAHTSVLDVCISLLYLSHLSVLKNSIHTQHEAFLGSLCLLFLCTFKYIYETMLKIYMCIFVHNCELKHRFCMCRLFNVSFFSFLPKIVYTTLIFCVPNL